MRFIIITRALFLLINNINLAQLPILLKKSGLPVGEVVATFTFVQCVFFVLGPPLLAKLVKHLGGQRKVMLGVLSLFIICQVLYWIGVISSSITVFFLAQAIQGSVSSLFSPFSNTLMELPLTEKKTARSKRGLLQTIMAYAEYIGSFIGILLISNQFALLSWGISIVGGVIIFVLFYIDDFPVLLPPTRQLNWRKLFQVQVLKAVYPLYFTTMVTGMLLVSGTLYLLTNGAPPVIMTIGQIIGMSGKVVVGKLTEKKGNRAGIASSLICLMLGLTGFIIIPQLDHFTSVGYWISSIMIGVGTSGVFLGYLNIAQETANKEKKTEAYASSLLISRLGVLTGQLLSGTFLSYLQSWYTAIGLSLLSILFLLYKPTT